MRVTSELDRVVSGSGRILVLVALSAAGCGGEPSAPEPAPEPATMRAITPTPTSGPARAVLPDGVAVLVLDTGGSPVEGVTVRFDVRAGAGRLSTTGDRTDSAGVARTIWVLGEEDGVQRLGATIGSLSLEFEAVAEPVAVGATLWGTARRVEYVAGDLPIVLAAPHGGYAEPSALADRTFGTTAQDRMTQEVARVLADSIQRRTGGRPHLILSRLHRVKLDPNREIVEAAQGDPGAERAWWEYHSFVDAARAIVERDHGQGLFVDLHGHSHPNPRVELGYLLSSDDLESPDGRLDAAAETSSLRALAAGGIALSELVRGESSLGALLEDGGIPAVPSPDQPHPGGEPYFRGGYSTARHGSRDGGSVSGVQVEMHWPGLRDSQIGRETFAGVMTTALSRFVETYLGGPLGTVRPPTGPDGPP